MIRRSWRRLRLATAPFRRRARSQRVIQRTTPLRDEDRSNKRRRWHVLVDLINDYVQRDDVVFVEVGSWSGYTSWHVARYCPQVRQVFAVDLEAVNPETNVLTRVPHAEFIQSYSDAAAERFEDESVDVVFIDADHSEEWVLRDLAAWLPKVRGGGIVAGHDYGSHNFPGVQRAVDAFLRNHPHPVRLEADKVWWTFR